MDTDSESKSPDSAVSSLSKKDKFCLVCGDRALGYNFNAVSCESCKAFFRRNAHKTIRGRCEGKCDVTVDSRSFCKRCRLHKCFTVGMRKDMILNEQQKKVRKQKIIINKLKKHGQLSVDEGTEGTPEEICHTFEEKISTHSLEELRVAFPNLSERDLGILIKLKQEQMAEEKAPKNDEKNKAGKSYPHWVDIKDSIVDIIGELPEMDRSLLRELEKAHEQSGFLAYTSTEMRSIPTNATEFVNVAEGFVRRIIRLAKNIEFFQMISKEDQIALLKGSVVEIMMLRSAVNYDAVNETWTLNTGSCLKKGQDLQKSSSTSSLSSMSSSSSSSAPATVVSENMNKVSSTVSSPAGHKSDSNDAPSCSNSEKYSGDNVTCNTNSPEGVNLPSEHLRSMANTLTKSSFSADSLQKMALAFGGSGKVSEENMRKMGEAFRSGNIQDPTMLARMKNIASQFAGSSPSVDHMKKMAASLGEGIGSTGGSDASLSPSSTASTGSEHKSTGGVMPAGNLEDLKKMFHQKMKSEGMENLGDLSGLRAMFEQRMKDSGASSEEVQSKISAELLKMGNPETRALFLSYAKFIKSLMTTIRGDVLTLKLLIMLSLFSADRQGLDEKEKIQEIQECYAHILQMYINKRFPEDKTVFAKILMKLTDLRDINEVHTKMLLKMKVDNIEPLLVEVFDIPS